MRAARELRRRQKTGMIPLAIEVPKVPLTAALVEAGLLRPEVADEHAAIAAAVADLADIPAQPRGCHCGNRSLRGLNPDI